MSAPDWTTCIAFTLAAEGGLVDDPNDPGGLTNFGISQAAYPNVDIRALTPANASAIYAHDYWTPVQGDALPAGVDLMVFDMAVNAGVGESGKILQRCVGVDADGAIGPVTLLAVKGAHAASLITSLSAAQLAYYQGLSGWTTFGQGWSARVSERTAHANALALGAAPPPPPHPTWLGQIEGWAARFL